MTMSLQDYYDDFRRGYWADENPEKCLCHGKGWALSDVDTWHACPIHYAKGMRHPDDEDGRWEDQQADPLRAVCEDDWVPTNRWCLTTAEFNAKRIVVDETDDIPF
jgi:hypothetical protein